MKRNYVKEEDEQEKLELDGYASTEVALVFGALFVWISCLLYGLWRRQYVPFLVFGVTFASALNLRHWMVSSQEAFRLVLGIYDVSAHLFAQTTTITNHNSSHNGMVPCETPNCSIWGDHSEWGATHPNWSVRFYERLANGPTLRRKLLLAHGIGNGVVFVMVHVQFVLPGGRGRRQCPWHTWMGRVSFLFLAIGLISGAMVASDHGSVDEYGNAWSMWGLYEMALCCAFPAAMGWIQIRYLKNVAQHRVWMWRYTGALWGSYWIFRVGLLVWDPLFRGYNSIAWLAATWGSAPLGVLVAERVRRQVDHIRKTKASKLD